MGDVSKLIGDKAGADIFQAEYESTIKAGKSPVLAYASAWCALEKAGYKPGSDKVWNRPPEIKFSAEISKLNEEKRIVYGWASVIEKDGKAVEDLQGDTISADDLTKAAHDFIKTSRAVKAMHQGETVGEFVESMVFTPDLQSSLGIDLKKVGWFVGFKVNDDEVWAGVKSGKYKMLSIGGRGKRIDNGA